MEGDVGNYHRTKKHLTIAAMAVDDNSLDNIKQGYMSGHVTKEDYANTLRGYQQSQDEMKSDAREKALAARNNISER